MRLPRLLFLTLGIVAAACSSARATILSVAESNLGTDTAAIIVNGGFGEDVPAFSDRVHEHNGPRFSDAFGPLLPIPDGFGTVIVNVPLPSYMVGGDYVRFANNARDNVGYSAVVTAAGPADWYLLIDNRWDGPNGVNDSTPWDDPILGGKLQWVIDDGWQRVNTGISPNSLPDYTGVDEGSPGPPVTNLGVGPGISVNNFYAVYTRKNLSQVTLGSLEMSGASMYQVVSVPIPEPASFALVVCGACGLIAGRRSRR